MPTVIVNGVKYVQKGSEIIEKVRKGSIPPPLKDGRHVLILGPYHNLIQTLLKEKFSYKAIHEILNNELKVSVSYLTVLNYVKRFKSLLKQPAPKVSFEIGEKVRILGSGSLGNCTGTIRKIYPNSGYVLITSGTKTATLPHTMLTNV